MPTYTYQCKACGHSFELFHGMSESPRVKCPECKGKCSRLIGAGAGVIFKGSGFYQTDYKKGGTTGTDKPAVKTEAKSETKASDAKSSGDAKSGAKKAASAE